MRILIDTQFYNETSNGSILMTKFCRIYSNINLSLFTHQNLSELSMQKNQSISINYNNAALVKAKFNWIISQQQSNHNSMYKPVKNALNAVGDKHRYQIILIILLFLIMAQANYMLIGPTFIFMNPLFKCNFSKELVDQSQACSRIYQCQVSNSFTLVSKLQLYCNKQADRNIIQAIVPIGSAFGLIIINLISDAYGRKIAIVLAQLAGVIGTGMTYIGGLYSQLWILVLAQFFCGFSGYSMGIMAYFILSQFCEDQFRQKSLITINYAWSATFAVLGLLFYYYNSWQNYLLYIVLYPMIGVLIFSLLFVVQGPSFLYGKKRPKECLQSLKTIAKFNKRMENFKQIQANFKLQSQLKQEQAPSLLSVIKNAQYLRMILILILIELGANLYFNSTNYALNQIGFDYGANMISSGAIELLAFIILSFTITKVPRKKGIIITYLITVVLGLLFFIQDFKDNKIIAFVILGVLRFFATLAYTIAMMLLTQIFPLSVQATCAGIIKSVAQFGSFLGPLVITFCINLQIYPIIVLSFIVAVVILIPVFFLKMPVNREGTIKETLINNQSTTILEAKQHE